MLGMLTAYFDDSGTHTAAEITLLAGLFGLSNQWDLFNDLWRGVLEEAVPRKSINTFHATDCHNALGEFVGWSRTESDWLMHELGRVITRCGLGGCATSVARQTWEKEIVGDMRRAVGDAEGGCIRTVFIDTLEWAKRFSPHCLEMAFVFDDRPERIKEYSGVYQIFSDHGEGTNEKPRLVSLSFAHAAKMLPLQASDLLAWNVYQEELLSLTHPLPNRCFHRKLLGDLTKTGRFRIRNGDRATIVANVPWLRHQVTDPEILANIDRYFKK
jgi:hypothetical protein